MDSLISMVAQRSGISEDKARTAVDTVVGEEEGCPGARSDGSRETRLRPRVDVFH